MSGMLGQRVGYVRVSTLDQRTERQLEQIPVDRLFTDQVSGKDMQRPQLTALLAFCAMATRWSSTAWIAWRAISRICVAWYVN